MSKKARRLNDLDRLEQETLALDIWVCMPEYLKTALIDGWMIYEGAQSVGVLQMYNLCKAIHNKNKVVLKALSAYAILEQLESKLNTKPGFML